MGAIMADTAISAGLAAGGNSVARTGGASTRPRVDALRPVSAVAPTHQPFSRALVSPAEDEAPAPVLPVAEPGKGMLSTGVQLILAETRAQEDQAAFTDRSTLEQAVASYTKSQASVRETIGLAQLAANASAGQPPAGQPPSRQPEETIA